MQGYEEAREKERYSKEQMMNAAETEKERRALQEHWPFWDHEEVEWLVFSVTDVWVRRLVCCIVVKGWMHVLDVGMLGG